MIKYCLLHELIAVTCFEQDVSLAQLVTLNSLDI
jgi:hypothetical protein